MSSFFDDASLVTIPSGYKDGKVYSVKPTSGAGDLTFTRNSNATRVDANGLVEKVRENLVLHSNDFSNAAWVKNNASATSGQAGYDGTSNGWLFTSLAAANSSFQQIYAGTTQVQTFSVYLKAGTANWVRLNLSGAGNHYFDIQNGVVGTSGTAGLMPKITAAGNGYYRCSITNTTGNSVNSIYVFASASDGVLSTSAGDTFYIQAAQREATNFGPTAYIPTTTTAMSEFAGVTASSVADVPRLDYSGGATCPSLLLEPQRTNLVENSEYLSASSWGATRCTISTNTSDTLSPEGVLNAAKMVSTNSSESYVQDNVTVTTSGVFSFFAKKGDLDYCHSLIWDLTANGRRQWFNLATGTVGGTTVFGSGYDKVDAGMEDYGNGWWRCWFAWNNGGASSGVRVNISSADSDINSPVDSYGYFYGCQVESGVSYPTSYIPTYGTTVTRLADDSYLLQTPTDADTFTYFFEVEAPDFASGGGDLLLENAAGSSQVRVYLNNSSTGLLRLRTDNPAYNYDHTYASLGISVGDTLKIALSINNGVMKGFVNGVLETTAVAATISFGKMHYRPITNIVLKQAVYFDYAISDADAINLTTL